MGLISVYALLKILELKLLTLHRRLQSRTILAKDLQVEMSHDGSNFECISHFENT